MSAVLPNRDPRLDGLMRARETVLARSSAISKPPIASALAWYDVLPELVRAPGGR